MHRIAVSLSIPMLAAALAATTVAQPAAAAPVTPPRPSGEWSALNHNADTHGSVLTVLQLRRPASSVRAGDEMALYARERHSVLHRLGVQDDASAAGVPAVSVRLTKHQLNLLQDSADVASVGVEHESRAAATTYFGGAAGQQLPSQWDYTRVGADWANTNGWTGAGQYVVIIDTGVDRTNPYLSGRVVNEACFATNNGAGACNNGGSWQYATTAGGVTGAASPCSYASVCAHGTFVAHEAAGAYGVARGAKIVAIRAAHPEYNSTTGAYEPHFNDSDFENALWYVDKILPAIGIVAAAVNYSVGGGGYTSYCDTATQSIIDVKTWVDNLTRDHQIPVVVSSGNNNYYNGVSEPACISSVISVGNTTLTAASGGVDAVFGNISIGSNSNATLDLLAPGTDICGAVPVNLDNDGNANGWQCGWIGTSMAAPQVTGAIAILTQKRPSATVAQFLSRLQVSGTYGGVAVLDTRNNITRTRINVANAVYYF